jgi:integrase/recombinase XerD
MSALEQALGEYLQLRHSLGHDLAEAGWMLPGFVAYLDAHHQSTVTIEAALAWAQQAPASWTGQATTVGPRRMTAARGFARYLSGIDPATQIPPLGLMPHRARWRRPFIYSVADVDELMRQARTLVSPLRAATYETLIGLLAASGLRIGEAIKLDRGDVDWAQGVLLIRESKFGKSRLVPLHPSSMQALERFAGPAALGWRWSDGRGGTASASSPPAGSVSPGGEAGGRLARRLGTQPRTWAGSCVCGFGPECPGHGYVPPTAPHSVADRPP